jgi:FdhD protein
MLTPVETGVKVSTHQIMGCVEKLPDHQRLHGKTRSAHAAMLLDAQLHLLSAAEDVGRHNALDKAVGKVLLAGQLPLAAAGVMSSRLSYELVQKAARAQLSILIGISRPTALAVDLARSVNMTLVCAKNQEILIFAGEERISA